MKTAPNDNPGVVAMPPLIFLIFLASGILINVLQPVTFVEGGARYVPGVFFLIVSGVIVLLAHIRMRRAGTNVDVRKPATTIVKGSVYRYTRNPMYLSMAILLLAFSFLLGNLWILILTPVFMAVIQKGVIEREEAYLERKFGAEYTDYQKKVRRWI